MKIKIIILICTLALAMGPLSIVRAEEDNDDRIRVKKEAREGVKNIRDTRKDEEKRLEKVAKDRLEALRDDYKDARKDLKGSTTMTKREIKETREDLKEDFKIAKKEVKRGMKRGAFEVRKSALVERLRLTLSNLNNIRARINDRITKVMSEGRDMTEAKAKLVIADDKILKAKLAVDAFVAMNINTGTSTPQNGTTTPDVDLEKPRKIGDTAIKAVKDARDALKDVVRAIAQAMGKGDGKDKDRDNDDDDDTATSTATGTGGGN